MDKNERLVILELTETEAAIFAPLMKVLSDSIEERAKKQNWDMQMDALQEMQTDICIDVYQQILRHTAHFSEEQLVNKIEELRKQDQDRYNDTRLNN